MGQVCDIDQEIIAIVELPQSSSRLKTSKPIVIQAVPHEEDIEVPQFEPDEKSAQFKPDEERQKRSSYQGKAVLLDEPLELSNAVKRRLDELGPFKFQGSDAKVEYNTISQVYLLNNGLKYVGPWQNGSPHGNGIFLLPDGSYLQGTVVQGKINGKGRIINNNGDYYEGDFKNNRAEGYGKYEEGKVVYEGEFSLNLPHGQGVETGENFQFVGKFACGTRKQGKLTWKDELGTFSYEGPFHENVFSGTGVLKDERRSFPGLFQKGQIKEITLQGSPYD